MGVVDRKRALFERIVRLRAAEQRHPDDEDIVHVRAELERELGAVVSRSLAARLLGVSHTALQRWVVAGDVPVVMDDEGRTGVPVAALTDLYEQVVAQRSTGAASGHVLESALAEGRRRAAELQPRALVDVPAQLDPHDRARLRSLAYHRAVAEQLRRPTVDQARHQLWEWRASGRIDPRYAQAWDEVLTRPVREIGQVLGQDTQAAADLRQSSPFAGALSEAERHKIWQEIR